MKDGKYSTEFWLTLLSKAIGIVVLFGVFTAEEAATLHASIAQVVESVAGLVLIVVPLWKYIKERTGLKKAALAK